MDGSGLWVIDGNGGVAHQVTSQSTAAAVWAPDHNTLAYVRTTGGGASSILAVVNADGGGSRDLVTSPPVGGAIAWTRDAKRIVYSTRRSDQADTLWSVSRDGGQPTKIIDVNVIVSSLTVSGDGRLIAFDDAGSLETVSPDGTGWRALGRERPTAVVFSPQGTLVAHTNDAGLAVADVVDGSDRHLADAAGPSRTLGWSPDGRWIAFYRVVPSGAADLVVVHPNGSAFRSVFRGANVSFSPDSTSAVVVDNGDARVVRLDDGTSRTVARGAVAAAWSPVGDAIAVTTPAGLTQVADSGSSCHAIAGYSSRTHPVGSPLWSPDGSTVAFATLGDAGLVPDLTASPLEPGTEGWGGGNLGAHRVVTSESTTLDFGIYTRDTYADESMQSTAEVHDPGVVTRVHVDFGDGTSWEPSSANPYPTCDQSSRRGPNPVYYQAPWHYYSTPGDYHVIATITTYQCSGNGPGATQSNPNTVSAELLEHRHPGNRRRS